jgi:hypothetical protein
MRFLPSSAALVAVVLLTSCTTYIPPAGRADFASFNNTPMGDSFAAEPKAQFPASIAAVRVQAPQYKNYYTAREGGVYGYGRYSVVTVKEVEDDADIERIASLENVGGLISINTLLLPEKLDSDGEIRNAAARLKADMVLLYTFDTSFHKNDGSVALNVVTLGLSPTRKIFVRVTASALLMDTRTGFIYAAFEASEHREVTTNAWESRETADRARRKAESETFKELVDEFVESWPRIVERATKGA